MNTTNKKSKRFHLLRFLLTLALKDIFKAECARQYILGDSEIAEDINDFEAWRFRRYCSERGIKTSEGTKVSQEPLSVQ